MTVLVSQRRSTPQGVVRRTVATHIESQKAPVPDPILVND
jgi:hypothetical protein